MKNLKSIVAIVIICLMLAAPGCSSGETTIHESGSTTVQPLMEVMAEEYMGLHPDVKITVAGGGSSSGISSVCNGIVDIGASSRELTESEAKPVKQYPIAIDSIAVIVNPGNQITGLTMEQLRDIFSGVITDWSEVSGMSGKITVVSREEGSGTQQTFLETVLPGTYFADTAILQASNGALRTVIAEDLRAIGYVSLAYADDSVKVLTLNGIKPSLETLQDGTYPITRRLLLLTRGNVKSCVRDFLDFCQGPEGQAIAEREGYFRLG
ncbi:MAG: phosphate ABC transporter substrate-binding protein [Dehalococcoidales bacterium]|jgi:phosphate transport system substrate-binding protein